MPKMVNAWALAASVLDGTLDEDYPIMTKEEIALKEKAQNEIKLEGADEGVVNVPGDINLDNYDHSDYWYDYNRNDLDAKNPFTDAFDYMMAESVVSGDDGYPGPFTTRSDNDDSIAHHVSLNYNELTLNTEGQNLETMDNIREKSDRKHDNRYKYHEAEIIRDIEDYVSGTYNGHYTGDTHEYRNVQTIDLMAARSLASSFCQSNILKYGSRYGSKDGRNKKDLLKVIHYAMLLLHFDEHYGKPSMTSGNIDHNMP